MPALNYMGISTADRAADQYAHDQGVEDSLSDAVDRHTEEIMQKGYPYYPFTLKHVREAVAAFNNRDIHWQLYNQYLRRRLPKEEWKKVRQQVINLIHDYWAEKASDEAYQSIVKRKYE